MNGLASFYSGTPFTITSAATSLNLPGSSQMADQIGEARRDPRGHRARPVVLNPLAFRPVTEPRFGNAGFNTMRGPGFANFDFSVQRQFTLRDRVTLQFRAEVFNLTNTAHFANPSSNASNAASFGIISNTANSGREGIDERLFRVGFRFGF